MSEGHSGRPLIRLPSPGTRVVVRYLIASGQATDALGELVSVDDKTVVVDGVRGVEQIPIADIVAAKEVPPRPPKRAPRA